MEIAQNQGLPTQKQDTVLLERDDGGPDLRIFKPFTKITRTIKEYDRVITVEMDGTGFCNPPENSYQRTSIDIITLGDSFTTCHNVYPEETWTSQLSSLTGHSVYNLGKVKIGIHEYLQILKSFGLEKSPKLVIMNIYEGNDLRDARKYFRYVQGKIDPVPETQPPVTGGILGRHSYTANLLISFVKYWQSPEASQPQVVASTQPTNSEPRTNFKYRLVFPDKEIIFFNIENTDRDEVRFARRLQANQIDIGVAQTIKEALINFVNLSKKHNFVPIITYTPSAYTTYADNVVFEDPKLQQLMPWFSQEQRKILKTQSKVLGYIFIDLTPALQTAARVNAPQNLLYYQRDLHLTAAGHQIIAEALSDWLNDFVVSEELSAN